MTMHEIVTALKQLAANDDRIIANHARGILIRLATADTLPTIAA